MIVDVMNFVRLGEVFRNEPYPALNPRHVCDLVDERIEFMLVEANRILNEYGFKLVIYSAYRSPEKQEECKKNAFEKILKETGDTEKARKGAEHLVADANRSFNCKGLAVDVGLALLNKEDPLELHERLLPHIEQARYDCSKMSLRKRSLRKILRLAMEKVGLSSIEKEFWHFELRT